LLIFATLSLRNEVVELFSSRLQIFLGLVTAIRLIGMTDQNEAELDRFRREWREEVSARKNLKTKATDRLDRTESQPSSSKQNVSKRPGPPLARNQNSGDIHDAWDEVQPQSYHDLEEKETGRKLGHEQHGKSSEQREPRTALEHYEHAVEKEGQGSLGDSVRLYRKAFRLDASVHENYKKKYFPATSSALPLSSSKPVNPNPSNALVTVPNTAHHSLTALPSTISDLITDFSKLSIPAKSPPTDSSSVPPCPIATIPEEILISILLHLADEDVASFSRIALVCKRLAYLIITEDRLWRHVTLGSEFGFAGMHYHFACTILGEPLSNHSLGGDIDTSPLLPPPNLPSEPRFLSLTPSFPTYRAMFRYRPRLRFGGCYISTVNYTRPGASSNNWTWNSPVLIVTYYRYLRFFRDGSLISLLTTSEPQDVVPYLLKEHVHQNHAGGLPQSVIRDALLGRWRLSGDPYEELTRTTEAGGGQEINREEMENQVEGDVHIETQGVVPRYDYKMHLGLASAGRGTRNNKLVWKGYWSYNKLTDDWAEFGLKNDRPFYWSRVRSYGTGGQ
jgi:F-box protein 9